MRHKNRRSRTGCSSGRSDWTCRSFRLSVRPMRKKWASCSTNGRLNFSGELLGLDAELWDYVIVHELLHFSVPNHGKLWKSLMRAHLGDYEAVEARLADKARAAHR